MKLDEKLILLRKGKGLTQLELAEAVNVSRQAVSKWESGGSIPSTESLLCLSQLYGVSVDYLLNEREERESADGGPCKETAGDVHKVACEGTGKVEKGESIMGKTGWRNYVISMVLTLCFIPGVFQLKLALGHDVSILLNTACVGAVAGLFICGALWIFRRGTALLGFSMLLLLVWLLAPGDGALSPAILAAGAVGLLGSVPSIASALSRGLQKRGGKA